MVQILTCSCGHRWESAADVPGGETGAALLCPVCGAASQSSGPTKPSLPASVLPPPPRRANESSASGAAVDSDDPCRVGGAFWPAVTGYEVLGELGRGGMGVVYKAKQLSLKRIVALKMLLASSFPGSRALARFHTEAEAVARLQHANIVHIYDIGDQDGCPFIAMEFVDGGSLRQRLTAALPSPRQAAEMLLPLVRAMHHAHSRGIVHRDLKPANVLLTADGTLKITDFGLAKQLDDQARQTESGAIVGTPAYMAPEQAQGQVKEIGPTTDVYALGAILYEMLTGVPPFDAETTLDVLMKVVTEEPAPPSRLRPGVPADLEAICLKCLAKRPALRYANAALLADDLERFLAGKPILARGASTQAPPAPPRRRWTAGRLGILAAAAAAVLVVVCLAALRPSGNDKRGGGGTKEEEVKEWGKEVENSIGMKLVRIPKGTFMMGSPASEKRRMIGPAIEEHRSDDDKQHEVEITKDFYLGIHEVTQKQYRTVMGKNPSFFCASGGGKDKVKGMKTEDFPVDDVNYDDAVAFCKMLSALRAEKQSKRAYRLPTEAEWEYACRGGASSSYQVFHFGNSLSSTQANFDGNFPYGGADRGDYLKRTCKVGSYAPNRFGLHDMHGNVYEWCADWYAEDYYASSPRRDPQGPSEGSDRVVRGGGWDDSGQDCRSAFRFRRTPELRFSYLGFRVAVVPGGP
jgi:formylglycine-generating enzyme required for sulfatase activity